MKKRWKRLIRRTDQGAASGHPNERRDDKVSQVEMMILGCDDRGYAAIGAAAAAAVGIGAAAAGRAVVSAPIEDWADYECWSVASVVGLGLEGQC